MNIKEFKEKVFKANLDLVKYGLVIFTWGNVSAIDRENGLVVIKPSGVDYENMAADDMVVLDLTGKIIEGKYKPSSDTPTHLELYRGFKDIGAVVHTHSAYAAAWAQARRGIPFYGTTHADYFFGEIPCTRALTEKEVENDYELNTGKVILETFKNKNLKAAEVPSVIVANHGPFSWGKNADEAVHNAVVLEQVAKMAQFTDSINSKATPADEYLLKKHYLRKHGKNAYYGQDKNK